MSDRGAEIAIIQNVKERLLTLEGAKEVYAEVLEHYANNTISERNMRALVYALSNYLPYLKFETERELLKRVEAIEARLEAK